MNRAVTAPMTPKRLAEIRGLQVDSLSADAEYNADVWALEQARLDLLAECDRLRAHVVDAEVNIQHRCPRMGEHMRHNPSCACHPYLPTPCPDCYSIEVRSRKVPYRAALASGDEAGPCEHGRTACQCYGDEVQP